MSDFDVVFLGTCAYDFDERLNTLEGNRFHKDIRRSSSVLLNGHWLIDCGPHTIGSLQIIGKPLSEITDLFLTHLHADHFDVENVRKIASKKREKLRIWVRQDAKLPEIANAEILRLCPGKEYDVGFGTKLLSLPANHAAFPQHFIFERNGKSVFYGLDGGWILHEAFLKMPENIDLLIMDCTMGDYDGDFRISEHNSIPMVRILLKTFSSVGIVGEKSRVYLSHLAPSLHKSHEETEEICRKFGANVAYDGLKLSV